MKVKNIMTLDVVTVTPETDIAYAAKLLLENEFNGLPVIDSAGNLVGILCRSDLIAQQKKFPIPTVFTLLDGFFPLRSIKRLEEEAQKIAATRVSHAMTGDPVTVRPDTDVDEVAEIMIDQHFHTLPVVDTNNRLVGVVGKKDLLESLFGKS